MIAFANEWGWWAVPVLMATGVGVYLWRSRASSGQGSDPGLFLTIEEATRILDGGEELQFADVRSESAYEASVTTVSGAVRLHPQRPLEDAHRLGLARDARIVTFCA